MKLVLLIGILVMGLKFLAWFLTHSDAILTDAVESIVNILAGSFALYSLYYAAKPKDEDHPYGHGKIEFLSGGVEGGMILLAGLAMVIKGVTSFFRPPVLHHLDSGLVMTAASGFINFLLGRLLLKRGAELQSTTLVADGKHLITDTWSSVGLVAGLLIIYLTGLVWLDQVITLVLGLITIRTGFHLIRESIFNLLDKSDYEKIELLIGILNQHRTESWIDIHNLRALKYGAVVHVDCHMTLPWYFSLEEAHREVDALGKLAAREMNNEIEFFIHADPCLPRSCSICQMHACKVRQHPFEKKLEWRLENVLPDRKHSLEQPESKRP